MQPSAAQAVLAFVIASLRSLTEQDSAGTQPATAPPPTITSATRLERDLQLESIDLTALAGTLRERYGERVDLLGHVAGLDLDEIIALTVGDVVTYVLAQQNQEARR